MTLQRIVVVGVTGSGKSTLALQLAERLDLPHIELDSLYWEPDWQGAPLDLFRARVAAALQSDEWVVDGNYSQVRDLVWRSADTWVWLDYPLPLILWRLLWRTLRRIVLREQLWSGNRERFRNQLSRDSLFLFAIQAQPRHRMNYPQIVRQPEYRHLDIVHLHSPGETAAWLCGLPQRSTKAHTAQQVGLTSE